MFMSDNLHKGRRFQVLNLLDSYIESRQPEFAKEHKNKSPFLFFLSLEHGIEKISELQCPIKANKIICPHYPAL